MADKDQIIEAKNFGTDIPQPHTHFHVKGAEHCSWGMKSRLSKVFNPDTGKSLMLAFDHGYFLGPTSGLERLDLSIPPLAPYIDCFMGTRGGLSTCIDPHLTAQKALALRVTSGSSVLNDDLSDEIISVDIAEAIRLNADIMASQVFIGASHQRESIENLSAVINAGNTYGIPTMGVVAVGKEMDRTPKYFRLATRIIAEVGAQVVKCYYCDDFDTIIAACPVPIVIAGGKKIPEQEALEMCHNAISAGAAGVDMGRNIFQSQDPIAMVQAVHGIVHKGLDAKEAFELYNQLSKGK